MLSRLPSSSSSRAVRSDVDAALLKLYKYSNAHLTSYKTLILLQNVVQPSYFNTNISSQPTLNNSRFFFFLIRIQKAPSFSDSAGSIIESPSPNICLQHPLISVQVLGSSFTLRCLLIIARHLGFAR